MRVNRVILVTDANPMYADFWNPISKVYREKFGITPTLVFLGDNPHQLGFELTDNSALIFTPHPEYSMPLQATLAMSYATGFYPDDTILIQGIDEVMLSPLFLNMVDKYEDDTYVQLIDDAYRPHHWSQKGGTSPSGLHIAKGSTFQKVYDFPATFHEYVERVNNSGIGAFWDAPDRDGKWGLDESYTSHKLREFRDNGGKVACEAQFGLLVERRIECERWKEPKYDMDKLRSGWYSQSHLCRPYKDHKVWLDKLFNDIPVWI
jgi:hypothetical protein